MKFTPFPEIKTERLILRKIETSDCDVILFLRSDATVTKFIKRPENRKTKTIADAIKFINQLGEYFETNKSISWGITLKNDPKIIGTICLWNFSEDFKTAEVGYDLDPNFQRKGIMNEAMEKVVDFGFKEFRLDKIEAFTHCKNENSKKLLEKNGFQFIEKRKDVGNKSNIIFELKSTSR